MQKILIVLAPQIPRQRIRNTIYFINLESHSKWHQDLCPELSFSPGECQCIMNSEEYNFLLLDSI
jgi:hypothetical protein